MRHSGTRRGCARQPSCAVKILSVLGRAAEVAVDAMRRRECRLVASSLLDDRHQPHDDCLRPRLQALHLIPASVRDADCRHLA